MEKLKIILLTILVGFSITLIAQQKKEEKPNENKAEQLKKYDPNNSNIKKDANYSVEVVSPGAKKGSGSSSSSFSFSSNDGNSNFGKYSIRDFYNKESSENREEFERKLLEIIKQERGVKKDEKELKIEITHEYARINNKEVSDELTRKLQEELITTLDHGEKYSYIYTVELDN